MNERTSADATRQPGSAPEVQFYIPATSSLLERRPRTLKHDDTFGLFDHYGDIVPHEGSPEGLYHHDTRFLSGFELLINHRRPLLLSSTVQDNNAYLTADLTNPDLIIEGRLQLPRDTIHIVRSKLLWQAQAHERLAIRNFDDRTHRISLAFLFESDFADLFEVRGHQRRMRGRISARKRADHAAVLTYRGLAANVWHTTIEFAPTPDLLRHDRAGFELTLEPGQRSSLFVTVTCARSKVRQARPASFFVCMREARRELRQASAGRAAIVTSNAIFNEVVCRSMADLTMLTTRTPHGLYPYAGIPWFSTAFGRDGIITAAQLLWVDPEIAKGVLRYLAAHQATEFRPEADAEPGKILHETRQGEMALLGEVPFGRYYGAVDSTPLFVMLAGMYFERTGDLATIRELWPNLQAALRWIDDYGDRDGDGFVEYQSRTSGGLSNQGWKDSQDSVFHVDGRLAEGAIALCEVQGYVYAAKRHAAELAAVLGLPPLVDRLYAEAAALKERFEAAFWCEDLGTYALALDGDKRPCRVRSSNAGQVLLSGIAREERAARIADCLMDQEFFSGWGIRTLGESEARYNPMSYHNGSVWPHDNALIALGFARYGLNGHTQRLFSGIFDAAAYMDLRRLPELFCGFRRRPGKGPTFYPVACSPQAWASAAPFAFLQACLGLELRHATEQIRFRQPRLPDFLDQVEIRRLRVGASTFDIMLRRYGADVSVNVLDRQATAGSRSRFEGAHAARLRSLKGDALPSVGRAGPAGTATAWSHVPGRSRETQMAGTVAAPARDFARCFFQVVLERGGESWVPASDAFERTVAAHADHPYVAYIQANRARRAGFAAAAERVREQEFPQIVRRKAGTRRNAPVFYRIGRPDPGFSLHLPYEVPSSHPLRAATGTAKGNPLRREPEPAAARSPWRRRLSRRRAGQDASAARLRWSAGWWQKLAAGAAGLLDALTRAASKRQR